MIPNIRDTIQSAAAWSNYDASAVAVALEGPFTDDYNQLNQCYQCHGSPDNKVYVNTRWPAVCFDVDNETMYVKTDLHINNDVWTPASSGHVNDPVFDNLSHYWSMDESSGTRADSKGSLNLSESGTMPSGTGKDGNAAAPTSNAGVGPSMTSSVFSESGDYSISCWFRLEATDDQQALNTVFDNNVDGFIQLNLQTTTVQAEFNDGDIIQVNQSFGTTWHLCVMVLEGTTGKISVDGAAFVTATVTPLTRTQVLVGSTRSAGNGTVGYIDEFGIYNVALSQGNVTTLWNGGAGKFYRP